MTRQMLQFLQRIILIFLRKGYGQYEVALQLRSASKTSCLMTAVSEARSDRCLSRDPAGINLMGILALERPI